MRTLARRFAACQDGAVAVEFALVSVALILFVFGIIEGARMLWTQQVLQAAATDTARCLAIGSAKCPNGTDYAVAVATARGMSDLQTTNVTIAGSDPCGSSVGTFTKVTITYNFTTVLPAYIPVPSAGLTATACFPH